MKNDKKYHVVMCCCGMFMSNDEIWRSQEHPVLVFLYIGIITFLHGVTKDS